MMLADCVWVVMGIEHSFVSAGIAAMVAFIALGFAGMTLRNGLRSLGGLGCSLGEEVALMLEHLCILGFPVAALS